MVYYRLDKGFGPAGSTTGYFLLFVGIISVFQSLSGLILIALGSFTAFSTTGCTVDFKNYRIKFSNDYFGFLRVGKWQYISRNMMVGLSDAKMVYRVYSLSNRSVDATYGDFRVYLYDLYGRKINPICKFKSKERALEEITKLSDLLGLQIKGTKHFSDHYNGEIKLD